MHRSTVALIALLASLFNLSSTAVADTWGPYAELEGRAGGLFDDGRVNFFVPLLQDSGSLLFADVRGQIDDRSGNQGNWGLAYRKLLDNGVIFGANGYFDLRNTASDNAFAQGGFGLELLTTSSGMRFNAYLPEDGFQSAGGTAGPVTAVLIDNNIFLTGSAMEAAFRGVDFEVEHLLWHDDRFADLEWWASAGVYHYTPTESGVLQDFTGPRLRTELRLFDAPLLGNDSRVVLGGQYENDSVRGSVGTALVQLRIPLGPVVKRQGRKLNWTERRMVAPVVRETRTVTDTAGVGLERALVDRTGRQIEGALVVDANTANVGTVISSAGADTVVVLDSAAGSISPNATVTLSPGQTLLGGGTDLLVRGATSGTVVTFTAPGTAFPGSGTTGDSVVLPNATGVVMADDVTLAGIRFTGGGPLGPTGFEFNSVSNVLVRDSTFDVEDTSILFDVQSSNNITFDDIVIQDGSVVAGPPVSTSGGGVATVAKFNLVNSSGITIRTSIINVSESTQSALAVLQSSDLLVDGSAISAFSDGANVNFDLFRLTGASSLDSQFSAFSTTASGANGIARLVNATGNGRVVSAGSVWTANAEGPSGSQFSLAGNYDLLIGGSVISTNTNVGDTGLSLNGQGAVLVEASTISGAGGAGTSPGVSLESSTGTIDATFVATTVGGELSSGSGITATAGSQTINLSSTGTLSPTLVLDASGGGTINVTQGAPGTGAGSIDAENNLTPGDVTVSGTVNFNQPPPAQP